MKQDPAIAVVGTFDSKGEEHLFIKDSIEKRGFRTLTINVGTKSPSPFPADIDLYPLLREDMGKTTQSRDQAIEAVLKRAQTLMRDLLQRQEICAVISAGGGTGTHLGTGIMRALPLGLPKVMVSTVASRNMSRIVGTKDITMIHSVVDIFGINRISGLILDSAAGAVCGMVGSAWQPGKRKRAIALTFFGFITASAEAVKTSLEEMGYEVIAFHANGIGGMAMEELAREGRFDGILDLGTHELADELKGGYCSGIGPERLEPIPGREIPRLVIPGGLDCAVLEFTRESVPETFRDRKIFFYDFRSAIRLNRQETRDIAVQLAEKLNRAPAHVRLLIPDRGWSEADREGGPLHDPETAEFFVESLREKLDPRIEISRADLHINDPAFARLASRMMDEMLR